MKITLILSDEVKDNPGFYPICYGSPITGIQPYSRNNSTWTATVTNKEKNRLIRKYKMKKIGDNLFESKEVKMFIEE